MKHARRGNADDAFFAFLFGAMLAGVVAMLIADGKFKEGVIAHAEGRWHAERHEFGDGKVEWRVWPAKGGER